jgi:hypothetical protein
LIALVKKVVRKAKQSGSIAFLIVGCGANKLANAHAHLFYPKGKQKNQLRKHSAHCSAAVAGDDVVGHGLRR